MKNQFRYRVKVCCIQNREEVELAVRYGADMLGFVSEMPSGPGPISLEAIAELTPFVPAGVESVLLTSKVDVDTIVEHQKITGCSAIQLCWPMETDQRKELQEKLPGVKLIQVVHVTDDDSIAEAVEASKYSHALILDSGVPNSDVPVLGGTGNSHDWSISAKICEAAPIPVYLAGGLKPKNIREAKEIVPSFGFDLCTGVRIDYKLDEALLKAFMDGVYE